MPEFWRHGWPLVILALYMTTATNTSKYMFIIFEDKGLKTTPMLSR